MFIDKLLEIIERSKFQDLLTSHNFKLVYKNHERRGGIQDSYSVGFESHVCKLGFYWEATIGAFVIPKSSDWETITWIDLSCVISYLLKQPINQFGVPKDYPSKQQLYENRMINELSDLAESFEPLFGQILKMFKDENTIDQWKPALEQYIKEDTRRRYG